MAARNQKTVERSALGRVAKLGDLYDARSDSFCGISMFNAPIPETLIAVTDSNSNKTDFEVTETFTQKAQYLNITAELQASLACIPLYISGSANFLHDQKSSAKCVRASMLCEVTTKVEQLQLFYDEIKQFISTDALKHEDATHVVVEVNWGGNAFVSAEMVDDQASTDERIAGSLALELKMAIFNASGKAEAQWEDRTKSLFKRACFKLYGDVLPAQSDEMPTTFEAACKQATGLRERISEANNGKGIPIKYKLFPLSDKAFRSHVAITEAIATLYRQIEEAALMGCVQLFDNIAAVKQEVNDLVSDVETYRDCLTLDVVQKAQELKSQLETGEASLRGQMADVLKAVRSGKADISRLDELKVSYMASDYAYVKLAAKCDNDFGDLKRKMSLASTFRAYGVKCIKGDTPIYKDTTINYEVYVLYASDDQIKCDPSKWDNNRLAFFNIAKAWVENKSASGTKPPDQKDAGKPKTRALIFVDGSFSSTQAQTQTIRIERYKNGQLNGKDIAKEQEEYLSLNVACSHAFGNALSGRREKTVPLRIRCPGSLVEDHSCNNAFRQWVCGKCHQPLQLGVDEDLFYCTCGRAPAKSFTYRCQDKINHSMGDFIGFSEDNLRSILRSLRPVRSIKIGDAVATMGGYDYAVYEEFDDSALVRLCPNLRVKGIIVYTVWSPICELYVIGGLKITYDLGTEGTMIVHHGRAIGGGTPRDEFTLASNERITSVKVGHGWCIDSLTFGSSAGKTYGRYGRGAGGQNYEQNFSNDPAAQLAYVKGWTYLEKNGMITIRYLQFAWLVSDN